MLEIIKNPTTELVDEFKRTSKYLEIIPYFKGIERLLDTTFPKVHTLLFFGSGNVNLKCEFFESTYSNFNDFLVWEQRQWPVANIIIERRGNDILDCRIFGRLR
jgi:hypothetical protein